MIIRSFGRDRTYAGRSLLLLEETDSTNSYCLTRKELLKDPGLVVLAIRQTSGRGSKGRQWSSGKGHHLFASFIIHPPFDQKTVPFFSLLSGVAVQRTLSCLGLKGVTLKWPNDIIIDGKKAGGILCERPAPLPEEPAVLVAGIGINVTGDSVQFGPSLRPFVTTLEEAGVNIAELASKADIATIHSQLDQRKFLPCLSVISLVWLISQKLEEVIIETEKGRTKNLFQEWNRHCWKKGAMVHLSNGNLNVEGVLIGLDSTGRLKLRTPEGQIARAYSGTLRYMG